MVEPILLIREQPTLSVLSADINTRESITHSHLQQRTHFAHKRSCVRVLEDLLEVEPLTREDFIGAWVQGHGRGGEAAHEKET